jgi:hypothetical protein
MKITTTLSSEIINTVYNCLIHIQATASKGTISHLGNGDGILDAVDLFSDLLDNSQD